MQLVAPDILADGKGLSVMASGIGLAMGLLIWLLLQFAALVLSAALSTASLSRVVLLAPSPP